MLTNINVVSLYMLRTPLKINKLWYDFKKNHLQFICITNNQISGAITGVSEGRASMNRSCHHVSETMKMIWYWQTFYWFNWVYTKNEIRMRWKQVKFNVLD